MGGRHLDPDRGAFWRSAAAAAAKALIVLLLLAGLTAAIAVLAGRAAAPGSAVAFPDALTATPGTRPAASPSPAPTAATEPTPAAPTSAAPAGVTVQVLDGGGGGEVTDEVVALLEDWGYEVVAVNPARCCYDTTTLFYSAGRDDEAEDLQARDGRFTVVDANPGLNETVDLHVVVGRDWDGP